MSCPRLEESPVFQSLLSSGQATGKADLAALLRDRERCDRLIKSHEGVTLDLSRQLVDSATLDALLSLAREMGVPEKIQMLFDGGVLNGTEGRSVLHSALRAPRESELVVDGGNVVAEVHSVLDSIRQFSDAVRSGAMVASDGAPFDSLLCIGIGGSYLGTAFTSQAFMAYEPARRAAEGRKIRFLANVDPAGFRIATEDLDANRTMVIVISKTFTTVETMKNAVLAREWLKENISDPSLFGDHLCAVSTNLKLTKDFGIDDSHVFGFWDWVGGRFSVSSAVGMLPLAIHFGYDVAEQFLQGARMMDEHFRSAPLEENMPALMALCSFYNSAVLGLECVALLPYSEDLSLFPRYVQQLCMESNGKSVRMNGERLPYGAGEVYFGESGTNGQHSFYQLLHQGRVVPSEFIGFIWSENRDMAESGVTFHQELMANFFAQPDALAYGRTPEQLLAAGCPQDLVNHKVCPGNRPSAVLLFEQATPYTVGALVALYEHRVAVQGFLWGINSFDQMGVELGKVLAGDIRKLFKARHSDWAAVEKEGQISYSTTRMLAHLTGFCVQIVFTAESRHEDVGYVVQHLLGQLVPRGHLDGRDDALVRHAHGRQEDRELVVGHLPEPRQHHLVVHELRVVVQLCDEVLRGLGADLSDEHGEVLNVGRAEELATDHLVLAVLEGLVRVVHELVDVRGLADVVGHHGVEVDQQLGHHLVAGERRVQLLALGGGHLARLVLAVVLGHEVPDGQGLPGVSLGKGDELGEHRRGDLVPREQDGGAGRDEEVAGQVAVHGHVPKLPHRLQGLGADEQQQVGRLVVELVDGAGAHQADELPEGGVVLVDARLRRGKADVVAPRDLRRLVVLNVHGLRGLGQLLVLLGGLAALLAGLLVGRGGEGGVDSRRLAVIEEEPVAQDDAAEGVAHDAELDFLGQLGEERQNLRGEHLQHQLQTHQALARDLVGEVDEEVRVRGEQRLGDGGHAEGLRDHAVLEEHVVADVVLAHALLAVARVLPREEAVALGAHADALRHGEEVELELLAVLHVEGHVGEALAQELDDLNHLGREHVRQVPRAVLFLHHLLAHQLPVPLLGVHRHRVVEVAGVVAEALGSRRAHPAVVAEVASEVGCFRVCHFCLLL
ncbi:glucose-6-phosphate isomerase [Babesia caballi]|uniref:Glucose-6-phosphate isomerase n=1 Tax=Babesia caballi TaxID=5871 RepID=A0AAV4LYQ3_BABCB|nr:glucose-6-phosphate isomerase [Babesia caballi]